jgi:site-specific recombinase XerD
MTSLPWRDVEANARKVSFWDTKNGKPRTLPLTTRALQAIQRQDREQEGPFTHIPEPHMNRLWDRTQAVLPALADTVIYTARHTCASRLVQRGVDLRRVKEWMGHKSITTTLIYAHLAPDNLMDAVEVLESDHSNVSAIRKKNV